MFTDVYKTTAHDHIMCFKIGVLNVFVRRWRAGGTGDRGGGLDSKLSCALPREPWGYT